MLFRDLVVKDEYNLVFEHHFKEDDGIGIKKSVSSHNNRLLNLSHLASFSHRIEHVDVFSTCCFLN